MTTNSRIFKACLATLVIAFLIGACAPKEKHIHHYDQKPNSESQMDGASSGGGSFADESSKWILQYAQKELIQDLRNVNPKIFENLPARWTPAKIATVIENARLKPQLQRARYGRELAFDYGVDRDGTPYIEVLKLFFDARSSIPINSLTVNEKRPYIDEVKLLIMHEVAHLLGYGLSEDTDMEEARIFSHLALDAIDADKVACNVSMSQDLVDYWGIQHVFDDAREQFGIDESDPDSDRKLTMSLLVHLPSLQGDFLIMSGDHFESEYEDAYLSTYKNPRGAFDDTSVRLDLMEYFAIPLKNRVLSVRRRESSLSYGMWADSFEKYDVGGEISDVYGRPIQNLGFVNHFGAKMDQGNQVILTQKIKWHMAKYDDGSTGKAWPGIGQMPTCERSDCKVLESNETQTLSFDKSNMTGVWSFTYEETEIATKQNVFSRKVSVPVKCQYGGYTLPANSPIAVKTELAKHGLGLEWIEDYEASKVERHDWRY